MSAFAALLAVGLLTLLGMFALRRAVFTLTLLRPVPPLPSPSAWPTLLVLVPLRNELATLPGLIECLACLDYPGERWRVLLIDDGSTDASGDAITEAAAWRANWQALRLPGNVGKPQALNIALAAQPFGEIIYIFDADHRPRPDCLLQAVSAFSRPEVAGVSGRTLPRNARASPVAYYAGLENRVHQLITMRGKEVLDLGPALLGSNNGYRRSALAAVGGFRPGVFLEDSDLTVRFYRAGWRVRYVPAAQATLQVPFTLSGFVKQHLRWGRGFNDVAREQLFSVLRDPRLAWPQRVELALFSLGYLDRVALLGMLGLWLATTWLRLPWGITQTLAVIGIGLNLSLPLLQIIAALAFDHAPLADWLRLPWVPVFFALDAGLAVWSLLLTVLDRPRVWTQTERAADA